MINNSDKENVNSFQHEGRLYDRLIYKKADLPHLIGMSIRSIDRLISKGQFPKPNARINFRPIWKKQTILNWIDEVCENEIPRNKG